MNKKTAVFLVLLVAAALGGWYMFASKNTDTNVLPVTNADPLNTAYKIEGTSYALVKGESNTPAAPGSATLIRTLVFGEPVSGDIDGDGDEDAALLLVHDPGGSGTFYYLAAAMNENGTYRGTNGVFLGDRIAPQNIDIRSGAVLANYADRAPGEPMTARPSIGTTKYALLKNNSLEAVETSKDDLIIVKHPAPFQAVKSPLTVAGEARGNWYFEASFPLTITDSKGAAIAEHYATAQGEWMTTDYVPFEGTIEFQKPADKTGFIIFRKDNPSGLPEHDNELRIPVVFE